MEFEAYMSEWILNDLSNPIAMLNGFSKCPYAKTAYLENKVKFYDGNNDLFELIEDIVKDWDNESTDVAVIKLNDNTSPTSIESTVDLLNNAYIPQDFIFLDDHVGNEERMYDVVFNNGKYNVLFLQRKSKLDLATKKLEKLGYYKNWTEEYYNEVVGWRS
jgi:hypothetical protein